MRAALGVMGDVIAPEVGLPLAAATYGPALLTFLKADHPAIHALALGAAASALKMPIHAIATPGNVAAAAPHVLNYLMQNHPSVHSSFLSTMVHAASSIAAAAGGVSGASKGRRRQRASAWRDRVVELLELVDDYSVRQPKNSQLQRYLQDRQDIFAMFESGLDLLDGPTPPHREIRFYLSKRPGVYISRLKKLMVNR